MGASIDTLPVELHTYILKFLLFSSLKVLPIYERYRGEILLGSLAETHTWIDSDLRSPSLFPFNVSYASHLWLNILATISVCWTRIVFDVSKDPTPFLHAFTWSKDLLVIEVLIYTSIAENQEVDKALERQRVSTIVHALQPHIHRCKSIAFDVTYSSSLPLPDIFFSQKAPRLNELTLDCRIDDIDVGSGAYATPNRNDLAPTASLPCIRLRKLALTACGFIYLARSSCAEWFFNTLMDSWPELRLSRFTFPAEGPYRFSRFIKHLSKVARRDHKRRYYLMVLHLVDLSLAYPWHSHFVPASTSFKYAVYASCIHLESHPKSFLTHFFSVADSYCAAYTFESCEIPKLNLDPCSSITLKNIIDDDNSQSLRNILEVISVKRNTLLVDSCSSFNDTSLALLTSEMKNAHSDFPSSDSLAQHGFEQYSVERISHLIISDCSNFSPHALHACFDARAALSLAKLQAGITEEEAHWFVEVKGKCPALSEKDIKLFRETFSLGRNKTLIWWTDEGKVYFT